MPIRKPTPHPRRGSATVELAICLPVLVFIAGSTVELNSSIFLKQTLTSAAHEGALIGLRRDATEQAILDRIDFIMSARNIEEYTAFVETDGAPYDSLESGEPFVVVVTADPYTDSYFVDLATLEARITAFKP
jgi:Flp pilus assembly protein TadG